MRFNLYKQKAGFTLIEVLLVVVIMSVSLVGIMQLFTNATRGALEADLNVVASNLIRERMEEIVSHKVDGGYAALSQLNYPQENFADDFSIYTRTTAITEVSAADFSSEELGSGFKLVTVTVNWGAAGNQQLAVSTLLTDY